VIKADIGQAHRAEEESERANRIPVTGKGRSSDVLRAAHHALCTDQHAGLDIDVSRLPEEHVGAYLGTAGTDRGLWIRDGVIWRG
jgi:hypothetical protein